MSSEEDKAKEERLKRFKERGEKIMQGTMERIVQGGPGNFEFIPEGSPTPIITRPLFTTLVEDREKLPPENEILEWVADRKAAEEAYLAKIQFIDQRIAAAQRRMREKGQTDE